MKLNTYEARYVPAVDFLRKHAAPDAFIMGSAELGFGLGFDRNLVDDIQLGAISGKKPDFIVVEENYSSIFASFKSERPHVYKFINNRLMQEFQPVYSHFDYRIYTRRSPTP